MLIFVSSENDAKYVIALANNSDPKKIKVICNFAPAFKQLSKYRIDVIDSQAYISTHGRSYADYKKIVSQSQMLSQLSPLKSQLKYRQYKLGDILDYSLSIYLAEVNHSLLVAAEILRREKKPLDRVAAALVEKETLDGGEFAKLVGKPKTGSGKVNF